MHRETRRRMNSGAGPHGSAADDPARRGRVGDVDWAGCLQRWSKDYEFAKSNQTTEFLAPHGLTDLTSKLATVKWRYALTGSLAAQSFSPIAPARLGMVYVDDVETAVRTLDLREVEVARMCSSPNHSIRSPMSGQSRETASHSPRRRRSSPALVVSVRSVSLPVKPSQPAFSRSPISANASSRLTFTSASTSRDALATAPKRISMLAPPLNARRGAPPWSSPSRIVASTEIATSRRRRPAVACISVLSRDHALSSRSRWARLPDDGQRPSPPP